MSNETEQAVERVTDDLRLFDGNSGVSLCRASAVSLGADLRLILTALAHSEARERGLREAMRLVRDLDTRSHHDGYDNGPGGGNYIYRDVIFADEAFPIIDAALTNKTDAPPSTQEASQ